MSTNMEDSSSYLNVPDQDPINDLVQLICIVNANNTSFCARLMFVREDELWFESKTGQHWMVHRKSVMSIRPLGKRAV
jgi:hypothetical protein